MFVHFLAVKDKRVRNENSCSGAKEKKNGKVKYNRYLS